MGTENVTQVLNDPLAQELMAASIPARFAYTGSDGGPRVVPVGFHWDGAALVVGTATNTPKVAALRRNPKVALTIDTNIAPQDILLVRGTATVEIVDGVFPEYLDASRKLVPAENWDDFVATVNAAYSQMAKITVVPEWAKLIDFKTRVPSFIEELMKQAAVTPEASQPSE